jgi:hypothetical protein
VSPPGPFRRVGSAPSKGVLTPGRRARWPLERLPHEGHHRAFHGRDAGLVARAELEALVRRSNGEPTGTGSQLTVRPGDHSSARTLFAVLEGDSRVISTEERAAAEAQERLAQHQAEQEAAQRSDRVAELEAQNAELQARVAELESH